MSNSVRLLQEVEERLSRFTGARHVVVTSSGRVALKLALLSLGLKRGNVIVPNLVCPVVPETIIGCGLTPLLADIFEDLSLDVDGIEKSVDRETRAIMPAYLYGCPAGDVERVRQFALRHNLVMIEDAAQAFAARTVTGRLAGSSGDVSIFSFSKGFFGLFRGGALATNREDVARKARDLRPTIQGGPDRVALAWKSIKTRLPDGVKRLGSRLLTSRSSPVSHDGQYSYSEPAYPYHFQDLTDAELRKCRVTLENIDELKDERARLVQEMTHALSENSELRPLFPYRPGFSYLRMPVVSEEAALPTWVHYLQSKGIAVDMRYRQASENIQLRDKSLLPGDYPVSKRMSRTLLPLPVSRKVLSALHRAPERRASATW